jgi:DNA-binding transcriptional LysR family regulator
MAGLGLGLALLPWSAVRDDVAAGRLGAARLADWPDAGRTVTLLRRRAGLRAGPVAPFTAIAREVLAKRSE